jgi:hypothetical protein
MASSDPPISGSAAAPRTDPLAVAAWLAALGAVLVAPRALPLADAGDFLIRNTIRLSLAYYAAAALLLLTRSPGDGPLSPAVVLARWCWTLAWAAYVVHVGMAFHHYHGWSHAHAVAHTRQVSGVGWGLYVSHLFGLLWTLDVAGWWLSPEGHATRPAWVGRALHGFMAFVVFNGTVVYEAGPIRWIGLLVFAALGALWLRRVTRGA